MSKTEKINKSKMVREYLAANEGAAANDVVEHFKSEGIEINKQFVYQTRTHMKNPKAKAKKRPASRKAKASAPNKQTTNHLDSLLVAKKLLESCGGDLSQAKKSLDTLSKLIS